MDKEQKKLLLVAVSVGVFLLVTITAALIILTPKVKTEETAFTSSRPLTPARIQPVNTNIPPLQPVPDYSQTANINTNMENSEPAAAIENGTYHNTIEVPPIQNTAGVPNPGIAQTSPPTPSRTAANPAPAVNQAPAANPATAASPASATNPASAASPASTANSATAVNPAPTATSTPATTQTPTTAPAQTTVSIVAAQPATQRQAATATQAQTADTNVAAQPAAQRQTTATTQAPTATQAPAATSTTATQPAASRSAAATRQTAPARTINDYWIQTGAYSAIVRAEDAKELLASKGFISIIETRVIDGRNLYRVRLGPYTSEREANYWLALVRAIDGFSDSQIRQTTRSQ